MKVHSVIRKGKDHPVHCEDFMAQHTVGRYFIGAVFDGCSGGNDSHFASSLFGKIFKQILTYQGFMSGANMEDRAREFMRAFVNKMFDVRVTLNLEDNDMLATFMMLVYDKVHGEAIVLTIGDGVICCDGSFIVLENTRFELSHPKKFRDMPDYISYDLVDLGLDKRGFDKWYEGHVTVHKFEDPQDISIATDGILTFNTPPEEPVDVGRFLLVDDNWVNNKIMLSKKVNVLNTKYKTTHKDDISIIRLVFKQEEDGNSDS